MSSLRSSCNPTPSTGADPFLVPPDTPDLIEAARPPRRRELFFRVPRELFRYGLQPAALAVYILLCFRRRDDVPLTVEKTWLQAHTGWAEKRLMRVLGHLRRAGLVDFVDDWGPKLEIELLLPPRRNFFWINDFLITHELAHLGLEGLAVYAALAARVDRAGHTAIVQQDRLARDLGWQGRSSLRRWLPRLGQRQLVASLPRFLHEGDLHARDRQPDLPPDRTGTSAPRQLCNRYVLLDHPEARDAEDARAHRLEHMAHRLGRLVSTCSPATGTSGRHTELLRDLLREQDTRLRCSLACLERWMRTMLEGALCSGARLDHPGGLSRALEGLCGEPGYPELEARAIRGELAEGPCV